MQNYDGMTKDELIDSKIQRIAAAVVHAKRKLSTDEITNLLSTCTGEFYMRLSHRFIDCKAGDVVICNFGVHQPGEINGFHVKVAIMSLEPSGMIYIVPISKWNPSNPHSLQFKVPKDIQYDNKIDDDYLSGGIITNRGKWINRARVLQVVGHVSPDFFKEISDATAVATTFSFPADVAAQKIVISALRNMGKRTGSIKENVINFLETIKMPLTDPLIITAFEVAAGLTVVEYDTVVNTILLEHRNYKEDTIRERIETIYKLWIDLRPYDFVQGAPSLEEFLQMFSAEFKQIKK